MAEVPSPDWLSWAFWARDPESIRDLVITIAALLGIPFVIWRECLHHHQTKAALQQAKTDRERRITDNFTRAVEQLGNENLAARLGAIYVLERIARESRIDHWPIMETLTAYVRERAEWTDKNGSDRPATDIQAILTVIGRRNRRFDRPFDQLNLTRTDLRGSDLTDAYLERAKLSGAHLEGSKMSRAVLGAASLLDVHLEEVYLDYARLKKATLLRAQLVRTVLLGANLEEADLEYACLREAYLVSANLKWANLVDADLQGADLKDACLRGADLRDTNLTQEQFDSAISDERTKLPPHIKRRPPPDKPAGEEAETLHEGEVRPKTAAE